MSDFPEQARFANIALLEALYQKYLLDPQSVDSSWRYFFEGVDFASNLKDIKNGSRENLPSDLKNTYRTYGHLKAHFNPLENIENQDLGGLSEEERGLKEIYCNQIGYEYMNLGREDLEKWMQEKIESATPPTLSLEEKKLLWDYLNKSESFENFLHTKYVGQTRFSLEGAETMIPLIAEMVEHGSTLGIEEIFIAMAHRGRLNVLTNILGKSFSSLFSEFEDDTTLSFMGTDDVKYHMGFDGEFKTKSGKTVLLHMAANPSHLESVDPVVMGETFGAQTKSKDIEKTKTVPLLIHGDASLAGQGVIYESMQLMNLPSYSCGGTIHLVVNNQIGYTTLPDESRSTRYATDIAKTFGVPVFHVNAEDPESCLFAAKLAVEIRQTFHIDVFIDLLCYRKYGHNEGDEPSFTQPLQYKMIRSKPSIRDQYAEKLVKGGGIEKEMVEALDLEFKEILRNEHGKWQKGEPLLQVIPKEALFEPVDTKVNVEILNQVIQTYCKVPENFHPHPKLHKWLNDRLASLKGNIDWATGECLAFGSLLLENFSVRLAGQDAQRGTFSQRHMAWVDFESGEKYFPLKSLSPLFDVINSPLSEFAALGFEYGYSLAIPDGLTLWEAQYGDFDNGAQIIIDQYISCGEQKWGEMSSLTLLLPHGYEGAGPEHSSARLERFLQLVASQNFQVVNPTTPAQYFHLLRRQVHRKIKKPLIIFTPKSLLRSPLMVSQIDQFTNGHFIEILDDSTPLKNLKRVIFCTGKIYFDLISFRKREDVAIVRIEQLYPLHLEDLNKIIKKYEGLEIFWVQEEPENMGAWSYLRPFLKGAIYVGRAESATTATGSNRKHKQEQLSIVEKAFA